MDWKLILTAGTVSALVSASVGLVTTLLTLRLARKKEQHTHLFGELINFRAALYEIEPAASTDDILIEGQISHSQFTEFLENFKAGDDLYLKKYRPYFDADLQKRIDKQRDPVISWIGESGRAIMKANRDGEEVEPPSFSPIFGNIISYLNLLTDVTDEQIKRVRV